MRRCLSKIKRRRPPPALETVSSKPWLTLFTPKSVAVSLALSRRFPLFETVPFATNRRMLPTREVVGTNSTSKTNGFAYEIRPPEAGNSVGIIEYSLRETQAKCSAPLLGTGGWYSRGEFECGQGLAARISSSDRHHTGSVLMTGLLHGGVPDSRAWGSCATKCEDEFRSIFKEKRPSEGEIMMREPSPLRGAEGLFLRSWRFQGIARLAS